MRTRVISISKADLDSTVGSNPLIIDVTLTVPQGNSEFMIKTSPVQFKLYNYTGVEIDFTLLSDTEEEAEYLSGKPFFDLIPIPSGAFALNDFSGGIYKLIVQAKAVSTNDPGAVFVGIGYRRV